MEFRQELIKELVVIYETLDITEENVRKILIDFVNYKLISYFYEDIKTKHKKMCLVYFYTTSIISGEIPNFLVTKLITSSSE